MFVPTAKGNREFKRPFQLSVRHSCFRKIASHEEGFQIEKIVSVTHVTHATLELYMDPRKQFYGQTNARTRIASNGASTPLQVPTASGATILRNQSSTEKNASSRRSSSLCVWYHQQNQLRTVNTPSSCAFCCAI